MFKTKLVLRIFTDNKRRAIGERVRGLARPVMPALEELLFDCRRGWRWPVLKLCVVLLELNGVECSSNSRNMYMCIGKGIL